MIERGADERLAKVQSTQSYIERQRNITAGALSV